MDAVAQIGRWLDYPYPLTDLFHVLCFCWGDVSDGAEKAAVVTFNGSLRDECLNEEIFDTLADARRMLALWRYDYNNVRPHSSLGNKTPAEARRALELFYGNAPGALAIPETDDYQPQGLSL